MPAQVQVPAPVQPEGHGAPAPPIREFLPSLLFVAALPIGVSFIVRKHETSDTQAS